MTDHLGMRLLDLYDRFDKFERSTEKTLLSLAEHLQNLQGGVPSKVETPTPRITEWTHLEPRMLIWDRYENGISWENLYKGSKVFLICSGPSLTDMNLSLLNQRGVITMGMNNSWCTYKPDMWVGFDTPGRFHYEGWMDPSILKLVPWHNRELRLRKWEEEELVDAKVGPLDVPNCWYVSNNTKLDLDNWLTEASCNWGGTLPGERRGFRSTFLGALRLLYYLGFQEVYLLGVDWEMPTDMEKEAYAFEENRAPKVRETNNKMFAWMSRILEILRPQFDKSGFKIFNCNPNSKLTIYPFVPFERAVENCTTPELEGTRTWYDGNSPNYKGTKKA